MQCLAMYYRMQDVIQFVATKTGLKVPTAS